MPRRAPEFLAEITRRGDAWMHRVDRGLGMALLATPVKYPQGTRARSGGRKRYPGRLFFGYFLLDCMDAGVRAMQEQLPRQQKKVPHLSVREPTLNQLSR